MYCYINLLRNMIEKKIEIPTGAELQIGAHSDGDVFWVNERFTATVVSEDREGHALIIDVPSDPPSSAHLLLPE